MARPTEATTRTPPAAGLRETWPSPGMAAAIYFLIALIFFLPAFLPGNHIYGTDYLGGGYFFYHFISERISAGELPKWVPYIFGGLPLYANPGSTYQPVHFLMDLLLPLPRVLAGVFVVHFTLAGLGSYLLAREIGCRRWVAFLAGISYQLTGILLSWVYAGHDGRIIVATTAPLFFWLLHRGIRRAELLSFAGAAGALALALLSFQIQNSYYLLLGGAIWAVFCLIHHRVHRDRARLARVVAMGLGAVAFGFLLSAVNFLPFQSYVPESPRGMEGGRGYEYSTSFSMPVPELLSLAVPEHHGASVGDPVTGQPLFPQYRGENPFKLHTEYVGALVVLLLALGFVYTRRDRYWLFFLGLTLFMVSIALGGNTPIYRIYYELLPGTKQFRAPSLSFFMAAMSLVMMAGLTLERLAQRRDAGSTSERSQPRLELVPWIAGGVVAVAFLGMMMTGGDTPGPSVSMGWGRFALFALILGAALWRWTAGVLATGWLVVILAFVSASDLWSIGRRFMHTVEPPEVTFAPDDVIRFLQRQDQPARMWTFPFPQHYRGAGAYGGNFPMLFGIEQVGGEHPNQLQRWNEYLGAGTETYVDWHNLVAEAAIVDHPDGHQAIAFRAVPGFLDAAAIRFVVSMAPLAHPALREVHRGSALVYENVSALPRAYLVPEVRTVPGESVLEAMTSGTWDPRRVAFVPDDAGIELPSGALEGGVEVVEHTPDRITLRSAANRPALLVLADNHYDGWRASVDGVETPIVRTNHTFRGVVVGEGEREVVFEFHPETFRLGLYITVGGFLLLLGYLAIAIPRAVRAEGPAEA